MSPTGGTKKIAKAMMDAFSELNIPLGKIDFLPSRVRKLTYEFQEDELLVFVAPVFFGRMPWCIYDFKGLKGNNSNALVVCVYGNRLCEDAPYETSLFLKEQGFNTIAYAEFVAQHSLYSKLGENRPTDDDIADIKAKTKNLFNDFIEDKLAIPYKFEDHELKERGVPTVIPTFKEGCEILCDDCRLCMKVCPLDLIDKMTGLVPKEKESECMGCLACMCHCTTGARGFSDEQQKLLNDKMEKVYEAHKEAKENLIYLQYK